MPISRGSGRRGDLAALLSGAALPLAFAPFHLYPLAILAPAVMFGLWREGTPRGGAWRGWLFGLGLFGVGVSWVYVAIHDYGHTGAPLAVLLTAAFVAGLALFPAALGGTAVALRARIGWLGAPLLLGLFPALWLLIEWVRGWFLTGFPWLQLGYAFIDTPLAGLAPWLGVYGMTWAAALTAGALVYAWDTARERRVAGVLVALLLLAPLWAGAWAAGLVQWSRPLGAPLSVAVVQGNVPQETKWDPAQLQARLARYAALTRAELGRDLIVWPENSVTVFYDQVAEDFLQPLAREVRLAGGALIAGVPVMDGDARRYYASMANVAGPGEEAAFYHKRHLVPFGEYVPLESTLRGLIAFFDLPMSGFSRGAAEQRLITAAGQPLGVTICYEDAFGEELIRALPQATLLVNGSNNAWYGDSLAPHQHLQISRMRSLETAREAVRATTNGISALIDQRGRLTATSPQFETHVLTGTVQPRTGATPYVRWGNLPTIAAAGLIVGALWLGGAFRRKSR